MNFSRGAPKIFAKLEFEYSTVPVVGQRGRAFVDGLNQQAIRVLGALQREDLVGLAALHHDGVDLAHADRAQRLFQLGQSSQKVRYPEVSRFSASSA